MKNVSVKRYLIIFFLVFLCIAIFAGCQENNTSNENTTIVTTIAETEETTSCLPDYSQMQVIATGKVLTDDIGMRAAQYKNSNPYAVRVAVQPNGVLLYGYSEGSADIELTDYFGHTAKITATVETNNENIITAVKKCNDDFIEVGQFGAIGNGYKDDTQAFQKAIDSASPGDTVYVYPGRYNVSILSMREGITLKMYTKITDAKAGYTEQIASDVNNEEYAILSGTRILNTENGEKGTTACSNFSIIGGVLDNNLTGKSTVLFACAENIRIEKVIFKDMKGNHTIQLMGCRNTVFENCMFAGYKCGSTLTGETVQIEPSRPNATGGPITFEEGEFYYSENITFNNCYFGKSDEAGPPIIAIGDHSSVGGKTVTNFKITNNFFDGCLYAAIRYNNISDVEISGNSFFANEKYNNPKLHSNATTPAFILLYSSNSATTYKAADGNIVTETSNTEQSGLHNINIKNNIFTLEEGADKRILYYDSQKYTPGVSFLELKRQERFNTPTYDFSGYSVNTNFAENISFTDNTINIKAQPSYFNYCFRILNVYNLNFSGNKLNLENGAFFSYDNGEYFSSTDLTDKFDYVINTKNTDKTITLNFNGKSYLVSASFSGKITLNKGKGGIIKACTDTEGNLTIDILPENGYSPKSISLSSGKELQSGLNKITASAVINISFTKN